MPTAPGNASVAPSSVHGIPYDYYGRRVATCSSDGMICVYDEAGHRTGEWRAHNGSCFRVVWAHPEFGPVLASCSFDRKVCVWEEVSDSLDIIRIGSYEVPSRSYVGRFNFKGSDQQKFVKDLSGGERNRVHLAKLLKSGGNLMLLDEPTNDLDVETLRNLEEALLTFPGCAVVISHDRYFLDRIATHILAFEGNSEVVWFEGNYQEYERDLKARKGEDAGNPKRIKYKKLTR